MLPALPASAGGGAQPDTLCERCGGTFHCGAQDPVPCACTGVRLSAAQQAELRLHYSRCLCVNCLAQIAAGASARLPCTG